MSGNQLKKLNFSAGNIANINENIESFPGGLYPIGFNNFWHPGVHIQEAEGEKLGVTPIADGELIAYRFTDDYIVPTQEIEKSYSSVLYSQAYRKTTAELYRLLSSAVDRRENSVKTVYLKTTLSSDDKKKLNKELFGFSNNFVLLRHSAYVAEKKIEYYSLYMHLLPLNYTEAYETVYEDQTDMFCPFYKEWEFTIKDSDTGYGLKLLNGRIVPAGSYLNEVIKDNQVEYDPATQAIKVKSPDFGVEDQIDQEITDTYLIAESDRIPQLNKEEITVYYDSECTIKKGKLKTSTPILNKAKNPAIWDAICAVPRTETAAAEVFFSYNESKNEFKPDGCGYYILYNDPTLFAPPVAGAINRRVTVTRADLYELTAAAAEITAKRAEEATDEAIQNEFRNYRNNPNYVDLATKCNGTPNVTTCKAEYIGIAANHKTAANALFAQDTVKLEDAETAIKTYFPNAKKVTRLYADSDLGIGEGKGYIEQVNIHIKTGKRYKVYNRIERGHRSGTVDEGLQMFDEPKADAGVIKIAKKNEKFKLAAKLITLNDLSTMGYIACTYNGKTGYISAPSVRQKTTPALKTRSDLQKDSVKILDTPLPVQKSTDILGYPGNYKHQNSIIHLELWLKDNTLPDLIKTYRSEQEYLLKSSYYFKPGRYTLAEGDRSDRSTTPLTANVIYKKVNYTSSRNKNIIKLKKIAEYKETWVNFKDLAKTRNPTEPSDFYWKDVGRIPVFTNLSEKEIDTYTVTRDANGRQTATKNGKAVLMANQIFREIEDPPRGNNINLYDGTHYWHINTFVKTETSEEIYIFKDECVDTEKIRADHETEYFYTRLMSAEQKGLYYVVLKDGNYYTKDPEFTPGKQVTKDIAGETVIYQNAIKQEKGQGKTWLGFAFGGTDQHLWISEDDLKKSDDLDFNKKWKNDEVILSLSKLDNFFRILKETDSKKSQDKIVDIEEILKAISIDPPENFIVELWNKYIIRKAKILDNNAIYELQNKIVTKPGEPQWPLKHVFRHLLCTLPTEWQSLPADRESSLKTRLAAIPYNFSDTRIQRELDTINKLQFFNDVKSTIGAQSDTLNYVHPLTFIDYIEKAGNVFNPYSDQKIGDVDVVDTPGLIPYVNNEPCHLPSATYTFNADYRDASLYDYHEGVDWGANDCGVAAGTLIKSLIYGKIIKTNEVFQGIGYGKFVIVQNTRNPTDYYLAAHLSEISVSRGQDVIPGTVIGKSGNSGTNPFHLHISYMKLPLGTAFNPDIHLYHAGRNQTTIYIYHPFDHSIIWKGKIWHG